MTGKQVLVAGIGNIFLGDDAFGVEVVRRLAVRGQPEGVRVMDFGIRAFDLAHALLNGDDAVVLVDATPRGGLPGMLYVIEPEQEGVDEARARVAIETHTMDPVQVLRLARALGEPPKQVRVVGCEPTPLGEGEYEEGCMGLSEPVQAVLDEAVSLVESVVAGLLAPVDEPRVAAQGRAVS